MRAYIIVPLLLFMTVVSGCTSNEDKSESAGISVKTNEVQKVTVSRSLQFGDVNEAILGVFSNQTDVEVFVEAIDTARKVGGQLDIRQPDYDVTLSTTDDVHSIHLWLGATTEGGMYTLVSDTGTGYTLTGESAATLKRMIYNVPYSPEQAELNGDIVNVHGKLLNVDRWDTFLASIESVTKDHVQVTSYSVEGDPIFYNLSFDGETIQYTLDTTMDAFGSPQRATIFCERIESGMIDEGIVYSLAGCQDKKGLGEAFRLVLPNS